MTRLCRLVLFVLLSLAPVMAVAAPMQAGAAPSRGGFIPVAAEIGQQLQELVTGDANVEIEPQETFGTRALGVLLSTFKILGSEGANFVSSFAALPQLSTWVDQQISSPVASDRWAQTGWLLVLVIGGSFAAGWIMDLLLLPLRRRIYNGSFPTWFARLGGTMLWLFLSLIPVLVFVSMAVAIIDTNAPSVSLVRFIVMSFVYALALLRLLRVALRFVLAPKAPVIRLVPLSSAQASYISTWTSWYGAVVLMGYFLIDIAKVVKVPAAAITGFRGLLALVIVSMTITLIHQKRSLVSTFIRGDLSAARAHQSLSDSLRLWFARTWHGLAIAYLVIGYFVTMLGPVGGFLTMQQGTVGTLVVLLLMRFSFYMTAKIAYKRQEAPETAGLYRPILRFLFKFLTWTFGAAGVAASWGVDVAGIANSAWGQRVIGSTLYIASTILALVFIYEYIHRSIERKLNRRDAEGNLIEASARAKTLLPMARYTAIIVLTLIGGLVTLSELGINTGPLLAGAGVLGVAVGFGSQTLVKDFLTGLFIILEDTITVGDIVQIGDNAGVVEGMTIRTVRLRDAQGNLHILPFSEISRIINSSKGFAYALMDIGVAYESDLDRVMQVMREVGDEMRKEPAFAPLIIAPTEMLGVEALGDSAITIRARIKTFGGKQWDVRRAYLLRVKKRFDLENIEIPYPHMVYVPAPPPAEKGAGS